MRIKRIIMAILLLCGIIVSAAAQQKITLKGIVTDSNKEPLVGAGVVVKGSVGTYAITDLDGRFTLDMEPYNRIEVSFIGFKPKEILIKEEKYIEVTLEEDVSLSIDEVVVTASGAQR